VRSADMTHTVLAAVITDATPRIGCCRLSCTRLRPARGRLPWVSRSRSPTTTTLEEAVVEAVAAAEKAAKDALTARLADLTVRGRGLTLGRPDFLTKLTGAQEA
jgi:hypothetical protein